MDYYCECGWEFSGGDENYVVTCRCGKPMKPLMKKTAPGSKVPCSAGLDALPIEKGEQSRTHKILYKMEIGDMAYLPNCRAAVYRRIYNVRKKTGFDYSWSPCINGGFVVRRDT